MTDIRFAGEWIHLEGAITKAETTDFMLDSSSRRKTTSPFRRALVHDFGDGLTINWNNDYPAGVSVNGCRQVSGHNSGDWLMVNSRIMQQFGTDFMLDGGTGRRGRLASIRRNPYRRALVHGSGDQLVLNWNRDYTGGVVVNGRVSMPQGAVVAGMDVSATLTNVSTAVSQLTGELAAATASIASLTTDLTAATATITGLTARVEALEAQVTP